MQNDIELLELAAKAAGIGYEYASSEGCAILDARGNWTRWWNPLCDDGDALRLMIAAGILHWVGSEFQYLTDKGPDPLAALRRMAVEFAAQVGKAL